VLWNLLRMEIGMLGKTVGSTGKRRPFRAGVRLFHTATRV